MKHNPFDAIEILKDTNLSIRLRVDSAIVKLNLSKKELQQLLRVRRIAVLLDKNDKLGLTPHEAIEWFIKHEILGENQT